MELRQRVKRLVTGFSAVDIELRNAITSHNILQAQLALAKGADPHVTIGAKLDLRELRDGNAIAIAYSDDNSISITVKADVCVGGWANRHNLNDPLSPRYGMYGMTYAAANAMVDLVFLLYSKGADVNHRDSMGQTPLMGAAWSGSLPIVEMLMTFGARTLDRAVCGMTAKDYAEAGGNTQVVAALAHDSTAAGA